MKIGSDEKRSYHNARLAEFCQQRSLPLANIRASLTEEQLGDALHPNEVRARIIAESVFDLLETTTASSVG